jgi:hypothetical protein
VINAVSHWVPWCLAAYAAAAMLWPALRWPRGWRAAALLLGGLGLLVLPVVVPADRPLSRALVAIFAGTFVLKLYDLHRGAERGPVPSLPAYLLFLASPFCHVYRRLEAALVPSTPQNLVRLGRGLALALGGGACYAVVVIADPRAFLLEHALKVTFGFVIVYGCAEIAFALWSLAGLRGYPHFNNFYSARTPADFWRRYNRPVTQYMFENVFRPAGGARAPVRGTLAAFFVSGVLHEYIAGIALQEVQGFQLAFFMIQGAAVAATQRLRPRGRAAVVAGITATVLFNIAVSILFCATAAQLFDLYSAPAPGWMHAR